MQVCIAMPDDKASRVDEVKIITLASLGLPKHINYLPLKDTQECALDAAMAGNAIMIPMAREVTVWEILEVHVPKAAAFQMVQHGQLVRDIKRHGWRFFDNLDYGCFSHQWYKVTLAPVGVDIWTQKALTPTFHVTENAVCHLCQKQGAVWRKHCGDCWLDFLQEQP